jgi:hypothetical protein
MKNTKTLVLAFALSAATLLGGLSTASAGSLEQKVRPPVARPSISCETNTAVRLLNAPRPAGEHTVTLTEGTKVLVRGRANGYLLVLSRIGRGWAPREAITCTWR